MRTQADSFHFPHLRFAGCDATGALEVDGFLPTEEVVVVDQVLHHLPFLAAQSDLLVATLIQRAGCQKIGVHNQVGTTVKQVTSGGEKEREN